jgi:hypothetical protein
LVSADDVNLLDNCINTIKEKTKTLLQASRDVGIERNAEKTKYMIMSHHLNSEQNQNIRINTESFENFAKFKYLGMTQIRITFMMKSRVDLIQGMHVINQLLSFVYNILSLINCTLVVTDVMCQKACPLSDKLAFPFP